MSQELHPRDCRLLAEFLGILSHPTRLQMLCALQQETKTVSELAEYASVSMSNASQHLRTLRYKGLVRTERAGQHVHYAIVDPRFLQGVGMIREALLEMTRSQADQATSLAKARISEHPPE